MSEIPAPDVSRENQGTTSLATGIKRNVKKWQRVSNLDEREQKNNKILFLETAPLEKKKKSEISCLITQPTLLITTGRRSRLWKIKRSLVLRILQ